MSELIINQEENYHINSITYQRHAIENYWLIFSVNNALILEIFKSAKSLENKEKDSLKRERKINIF